MDTLTGMSIIQEGVSGISRSRWCRMHKKQKFYKVLIKGVTVMTTIPGKYAGWRPGKIFGRLDCKSGKRMKKENRVFFRTWEEAIEQGYRPCKKCKPTR